MKKTFIFLLFFLFFNSCNKKLNEEKFGSLETLFAINLYIGLITSDAEAAAYITDNKECPNGGSVEIETLTGDKTKFSATNCKIPIDSSIMSSLCGLDKPSLIVTYNGVATFTEESSSSTKIEGTLEISGDLGNSSCVIDVEILVNELSSGRICGNDVATVVSLGGNLDKDDWDYDTQTIVEEFCEKI